MGDIGRKGSVLSEQGRVGKGESEKLLYKSDIQS